MRCQHCGKMIDDTVQQCPVCGTYIERVNYSQEKRIQQDVPVQQFNNGTYQNNESDIPLKGYYSDGQKTIRQQAYSPKTNNYNDYPTFDLQETNASLHDPTHNRTNRRGKPLPLLIISVIIMLLLALIVVLLMKKNNNGSGSDNNASQNAVVSSETEKITTTTMATQQTETISQTTTEQTTTATTTTTEQTTTTTKAPTSETTTIPEDARKNNYVPLDTVLVVKADEVDTLPLRTEPNKSSSKIIKRIPDGTSVHVLGFRDIGSEVWFRINYDNALGWCRGGMIQPNNLGVLSDDRFNVPGLEKWKTKFQLQTPNSTSNYGTASFKGTLYFIPDLSSGVQKRFRSKVTVNVTAKQGEWYYVEFYSDEYYSGWVYSSYLSF